MVENALDIQVCHFAAEMIKIVIEISSLDSIFVKKHDNFVILP